MSTDLVLMKIVSEANNGKLGDLPKSRILDTSSEVEEKLITSNQIVKKLYFQFKH